MAKLPALPPLPPSPVYLKEQVPEKFRALAFVPVALVLGIVLGPVAAYAAVGPPFTRAQVAKLRQRLPKTPPDKRPFLFFPAFVVAAALLYFVLGFVVTGTPLEEDLLALLALGV